MIGGEYKFAPLEFTPLYYGIPTSLDIELAGEDSVADKFDGKYELGPNKVGGLVEPIGFGLNLKEYLETKKGSDAAKHPNKGLQEVYSEVDPTTRKLVLDATPDRIISISEQSGLSSTYISLLLSDAVSYPLFKLLNNPVLPYWSPESGFNTNGLGVVDGGANSLTGLPSVLRRGVKKAMVFYSPNCAMDTEGAAQAKVSGLAHIAGYFGRMEDPKNENISGGVTEAAFNKMHQVFPSDRWDEFLDKGLKCFQAGEPIVVPMTIPVLANPLINVKGGYDLKIIFVSMDEDRKWFEKIPHDLQERFKKDNAHEKTTAENVKEMAGIKEVDLENFPFVSVKKFDYSPILANSLSQLATWEIMHTGPVINEFFGY